MVILAGDHVYKMDYEWMLQQHVDSGADVTIGCLEVPRMEAVGFGVMHVNEKDEIIAFVEKPADPPPIPDKPDFALASMGIYVFHTKFLLDALRRDAADPTSSRDFGKDIIPYIVKNGKAVAHRFAKSCVRSDFEHEPYWRDVGTIDAYWQANIDLTAIVPELDIYDKSWPIWTYAEITRRRNSSMTTRIAAARPPPQLCQAIASFQAPCSTTACSSRASGPTPSPSWKERSSCRT